MIIRHFKEYIDMINEGLIKTYPGDLVIKDIIKSLSKMGLDVLGSFEDDKIKLVINKFNLIPLNKIRHLFDHIDTFVVNRGGWFPSTMNIIKSSNNKISKYNFSYIIRFHDEIESVVIEYESKFEEETDIPDRLYHLSIKEYSKKIRRNGLSPKSKSKLSSHLDRIYLCKRYQDCVDLIPQMMFYYTGERDDNIYKLGKEFFGKDITPIIYEIDNSDGIINKLYIDINYNGGYYTLNNIPPDAIEISVGV